MIKDTYDLDLTGIANGNTVTLDTTTTSPLPQNNNANAMKMSNNTIISSITIENNNQPMNVIGEDSESSESEDLGI
ncbi:hypothetical protein [Candidatus Tisiphia endosymbiont of Hybos culiciformis]|uniref:hypothetical protein n=1 Tax=Candidatus Tisiphia endosymbiont of Hybos culiciformis TaxID=3139331 RepID=UPI003CCAE44D